jgi:predicted Fe-Mo cluster-binding NifX family protein
MKIAIVSEDKINISEHFGASPVFLVFEIQEGKIIGKEEREKPGHKKFAGEEEHPLTDEKGHHGIGAQASERHKQMYEIIKDCEVLIVGRMGFGAYEDMTNFGLKVISTDIKTIDEAVSFYQQNKLTHINDRVC